MKASPSFKAEFSYVVGAENSFLITRSDFFKNKKLRLAEIKKICRSAVPSDKSDGLIFLSSLSTEYWMWQFYNSDGSEAEMCGNAARCVMAYLQDEELAAEAITLKTLDGNVSVVVDSEPEVFSVKMPPTKILREQLHIQTHVGLLVDTGVPHFVIEAKPDFQLGRKLRFCSEVGVRGANITFVADCGDHMIQAVTYERGVEDFTAACGTGAVAAAVYFRQKDLANKTWNKSSYWVTMPGGILEIDWPEKLDQPVLTGEAHVEIRKIKGNFRT